MESKINVECIYLMESHFVYYFDLELSYKNKRIIFLE
jgi:hypothetical protein